MALALALGACGGGPEPGQLAVVEGFAGLVAADEPNATVIGREVLGQNGGAADAAVAMAFTMGVTLPSRAGLGGGGLCLFFEGEARTADAILFLPLAGPSGGVTPAVPRGMALLHARHGLLRWELLLKPAENLARFGHPISRAFAADIRAGREKIAAGPELAPLFLTPEGAPLAEGARLRQPELSALVGGLRLKGAGYLHSGGVPARLTEAAAAAGLALAEQEVIAWVPQQSVPLALKIGSDQLYLPPAPAAGGAAAAELWRRLEPVWDGRQESARSAALLAAAGAAGLTGGEVPSAGFVVADRFGDAVACSFTMNALFGSGRMPPGSGLLLAAPSAGPPPLTVALRGNENTGRLRYAAASGSPLALVAVTLEVMAAERPLEAALASPRPWLEDAAVRQEPANGSAPDRVSALYCPDGLVGEEERAKCRVANDPRGHGLAAVAR